MNISISENTQKLLKDVFETDASGKPIAKFELNVSEPPRRSIEKPLHSLEAWKPLQAIDVAIDKIVDSLGEKGKDTNTLIAEWDLLAAHASKIMGQAIYLDTSDRNSWDTIRMTMIHEPGKEKFQSRYSLELKNFWKGDMDKHLETDKEAEQEGPGL